MNTSNVALTVATPGSAGHELPAPADVLIPAHTSVVVDTGVTLSIQPGTYAQICSKSGHAFNGDIVAFPGLIDSDYTGSIAIKLTNMSDREYRIPAGKSMAQILFGRYSLLDNAVVISTVTRTGGFGSTNQ